MAKKIATFSLSQKNDIEQFVDKLIKGKIEIIQNSVNVFDDFIDFYGSSQIFVQSYHMNPPCW